jgi:class 3 adenylate cyclase
MDHLARTDLHQWAGVDRDGARTTLAVVFTDIIDSTTITKRVGDGKMFDMLYQHFGQARFHSNIYDGFEIKLIGDAYMVAFKTADAALRFALAFRQGTGDPLIAIRVGIHVGPVRIWDGDIYGLVVNYAARLAHIKVSGDEGIFLSATAKEHIQSEFGTSMQDFNFSRLAPTQLQGFGPREEVWQVITRELRVARAARSKAKQEDEARKHPKPAIPQVPGPPDLSGLLRRFQNPNKN